VTPGSRKKDDVQGSEGITSYRDDKGNGAYSVKGNGQVTDGVSGSKITYRDSRPVGFVPDSRSRAPRRTAVASPT